MKKFTSFILAAALSRFLVMASRAVEAEILFPVFSCPMDTLYMRAA